MRLPRNPSDLVHAASYVQAVLFVSARARVRAATSQDRSFLDKMVLEAAFPPSPRPPKPEALRMPHVARMVDGWPRSHDAGVVAVARNVRVGATWYRLFERHELRSQWADPEIPELAIAVSRHHRGRGLGRSLLSALLERARQDGYEALDLQVGQENLNAIALYESSGFEPVGTPETRLIWMRRRFST